METRASKHIYISNKGSRHLAARSHLASMKPTLLEHSPLAAQPGQPCSAAGSSRHDSACGPDISTLVASVQQNHLMRQCLENLVQVSRNGSSAASGTHHELLKQLPLPRRLAGEEAEVACGLQGPGRNKGQPAVPTESWECTVNVEAHVVPQDASCVGMQPRPRHVQKCNASAHCSSSGKCLQPN